MALKNSTKDLIKKSFDFQKLYIKYLIIAVILTMISVILLVYAPKILGKLVNGLFQLNSYSDIGMYSLIDELFVIFVLYSVAYLIRIPVNRILSKLAEKVSADVKISLYEKFDNIPVYELNDDYSGNIMARLNNDTATIKSFIGKNLGFILSNNFVIIAVILMVMQMKIELSFIFLVMIPVYVTVISISFYKTKDYYKDFQDDLGNVMGFMGDYLSNRLMIRLYNAKDYINRSFIPFNDKQNDDYFKSRFYSEFNTPLYLLLSYFIQISQYIFTGYFVYRGMVSLGEFSVFLLYVQMFRKPITSFSYSVNSIKSFLACIDRVSDIIDYPANDEKVGWNKDDIIGEIEFRDISYNNLSGFNLKVNYGDIINFTGENRNDLVNLLLNFSKWEGGEILLDGCNIGNLRYSEYANIFGVSMEDDQIITGTIAENILFGSPDLGIEDVERICDKLEISEIIERFPDKYDTQISDDSITLSTGERKLICVARALIKDPKILILNYPNYLSQELLKEVVKGKTVILLTPDEDSINFQDKTILIN